LIITLSKSFIIAWKVTSEFVSPKNITISLKAPSVIENAAFYSFSSLILTLLYPHLRSIFVNTFFLCYLSNLISVTIDDYFWLSNCLNINSPILFSSSYSSSAQKTPVISVYHISSLPIPKIHLCSDVVIITSLIQAHLPWWLSFLQYISVVVIQQLRYLVFYDRDTPIELSLLWQSSSIQLYQCFTTEISA